MDDNLRREIILDNYKEPYNKGLVEDGDYLKTNTNSESCIDNLDFQLKVDNGKLSDIRFDGEACAISTSASSILIKTLIGLDIDQARKVLINYRNMIDEKSYDKELLGELNVYSEIYKQPNRKTCALLPVDAVDKLLGQLK